MVANNTLMLQKNHWVYGVGKKYAYNFYDNIKEKCVEKLFELKWWNKKFAVMQQIYLLHEPFI